tara:strand:+ start:370 stop:489 length:120 start_codon:yes stop_codon:yes gene_type:complete
MADGESVVIGSSPWHGLPSMPHVEFMKKPNETLCSRSES